MWVSFLIVSFLLQNKLLKLKLSGTERKNDQSSRSNFYIQQHAGRWQGQTVQKVHSNLNKGASGSMKLKLMTCHYKKAGREKISWI